jgi:UDP-3-O-[3-hydroxymyristoyl] glucosamine N-acyltransferase
MSKFFKKKIEFLTVSQVLKLTNAKLEEKVDADALQDIKIFDIKPVSTAKSSDITFFTNPKYTSALKVTEARACLVKAEHLSFLNSNTIPIITADPHFAFALILQEFYGNSEIQMQEESKEAFISTTAKIAATAKIGKNVKIFDNVVISENVEIDDNSIIMPNSFIGSGVKIGKNNTIHDCTSIMFATIGNNCIIRSGVRIGTSGFGFVPNFKTGEHFYIPQISGVIIGDKVDIGANTVIDRGCLEDTIIEDNVKLDNLVHIGHGVHVKSSCFIAAGAGIAGSAEIGKFVFVGGQVGIAPHTKIADFTQITPQSGVINDVEMPKTVISGSPALPKLKWQKMQIKMQQLVSKKN